MREAGRGIAFAPLVKGPLRAYSKTPKIQGTFAMGINSERDIEANLQIGPTTEGMVRLFVEANGIEVPMDFEPEEAEEIAEELRAAAAQARKLSK